MCYRSPVSDTSRGQQAGRQTMRHETRREQPVHSIGIRELRQHASVYVDLAEKGETVDITNRGRLVARLVPARGVESPLARLIAAGILRPPEALRRLRHPARAH